MAKAIQFKVSLEGITPEIWRRFAVRDDITFQQLHEAIQAVMGWENYHLYQFHVGGLCFEEPDPETLKDGEDERSATAEKVLDHVSVGDKPLAYLYDFGDCWEHKLEIEKVLDADEFKDIPCCVGGERACPPEDCGGVHGFEHLLNVREDKKHEEYRELIVDWLGEGYDPETFSVDEADERLNDSDLFAEDDGDDEFVPLRELLIEDTPEAKSIKSIEGKELNYANYLFSVESAVMEYFMDDRKLTDKDVIHIIEKVKANYLEPLDSFGEGLERDIMLGLSSALQGGGLTHHELKLVLSHVLWAIDNRSWLGSSQAYVKWLPYYFNLYSDEEDERYRKNFTRRARRIGVPQKEIGGMLERSEDDCEMDNLEDLRFDSGSEEENQDLFIENFLSADYSRFQSYTLMLERNGDYASLVKAYKVAMEVMGLPALEFALGLSYLKMGDMESGMHHAENAMKRIEDLPDDNDAFRTFDKQTILGSMKDLMAIFPR